jgi:hypothetical protein
MSIDRTQWRVIMVLYGLIIVTVAMVQASDRVSNAIALFLVSSAAAASFALLLAYDHPVNARGGAFVEPAPLRELLAKRLRAPPQEAGVAKGLRIQAGNKVHGDRSGAFCVTFRGRMPRNSRKMVGAAGIEPATSPV